MTAGERESPESLADRSMRPSGRVGTTLFVEIGRLDDDGAVDGVVVVFRVVVVVFGVASFDDGVGDGVGFRGMSEGFSVGLYALTVAETATELVPLALALPLSLALSLSVALATMPSQLRAMASTSLCF